MKILTKIVSIIKTGFIKLGKLAPMLTKAATTVEVMTGNEELVELTEKAGEAAVKVGTAIETGESGVVEAVSEQIATVAASEKSDSVAKVAGKVAKTAKKIKV